MPFRQGVEAGVDISDIYFACVLILICKTFTGKTSLMKKFQQKDIEDYHKIAEIFEDDTATADEIGNAGFRLFVNW